MQYRFGSVLDWALNQTPNHNRVEGRRSSGQKRYLVIENCKKQVSPHPLMEGMVF